MLGGRREWHHAWFGLEGCRVKIKVKERLEELYWELQPWTLFLMIWLCVKAIKRTRHTWYELIYRQCLLRLIRNTSGLGSSSSLRGLALGSPLDFFDFFFFFFLGMVVVSWGSVDKVASRGREAKTVELSGDWVVKVAGPRAIEASAETGC